MSLEAPGGSPCRCIFVKVWCVERVQLSVINLIRSLAPSWQHLQEFVARGWRSNCMVESFWFTALNPGDGKLASPEQSDQCLWLFSLCLHRNQQNSFILSPSAIMLMPKYSKGKAARIPSSLSSSQCGMQPFSWNCSQSHELFSNLPKGILRTEHPGLACYPCSAWRIREKKE